MVELHAAIRMNEFSRRSLKFKDAKFVEDLHRSYVHTYCLHNYLICTSS